MTVEQEEKILKAMGLIILFSYFPMTYLVKNDLLKWIFYIVALVIMLVLLFRKYVRDKNANRDLSRYKRMLIFIGISVLITVFALFYPNL